jgi:hypothetical protein
MPLESELKLQEEDVEQIVASVFSTMMGLEIGPSQTASTLPAGLVTGAVYLAGGWRGAVLIHCFPQQVCQFAGRFLARSSNPLLAGID